MRYKNYYSVTAGSFALSLLLSLAPAHVVAKEAATEQSVTELSASLKTALQNIDAKSAKAGEWQLKSLEKFYKNRNYESFWLQDAAFKRDTDPWLNVVDAANLEGLNLTDYQFKNLLKLALPKDSMALAEREIQLTNSILHYIRDISIGRAQPAEMFPKLFLLPQDRDFAGMLENAANNRNPKRALQALAPNHEDYQKLKQTLVLYRKMEGDIGNWQSIAVAGVISPGESDKRLPAIRQRMQQLGRLQGQQDVFKNLEKNAIKEIKETLSEEIEAIKTADTQIKKQVENQAKKQAKIQAAKEDFPKTPPGFTMRPLKRPFVAFKKLTVLRWTVLLGPKPSKS